MDGIIVINKEKGCTSNDVVQKTKKIFNEKVGHTGTLDPMATGVLPLLIGKGTQCSKYLINHDKTYIVKLQLGSKTTTADSEGEIIETKPIDKKILEKTNVIKILETFIGKQAQIPPIYSAIKVNGKKLYEYARKGQKVEIKPRKIEIYKIELLDINLAEKQIDFKVSCSKGTYIRSLCEDISIKLGTVGFMKELQRTQVGKFRLEDTVTLDDLQKNYENINYIEQHFINIEKFFKDKEIVELDNKKLQLLLNGVKLNINKKDGLYKIYSKDKFVGIGIVEKGLLKRDIILE